MMRAKAGNFERESAKRFTYRKIIPELI